MMAFVGIWVLLIVLIIIAFIVLAVFVITSVFIDSRMYISNGELYNYLAYKYNKKFNEHSGNIDESGELNY